MFLPKIARLAISTILGFSLVLINFSPALATHTLHNNESVGPGFYQQQSNRLPQYQIVPIPPTGQDQGTASAIPNPNSDPNIQQAFIHDDIWGVFEDLYNFGSGLFTDIFKCVSSPQTCVSAGLNALGELFMIVAGKTGLRSMAGERVIKCIEAMATEGALSGLQTCIKQVAQNPDPSEFGLIGFGGAATEGMLAMPMPVSSGQYFASINPFKPANAAIGDGFSQLGNSEVILNLWEKMRDASLILLVVVLVVAGFMIMLRFPIGPRNVVTVQNALPRIVIAMLLITFSFAIAGLLVDLTKFAADIINGLVDVPLSAGAAIGIIFLLALGAVAVLVFGGPAGPPLLVGALFVLLFAALVLAVVILIIFFILIYKLLTRYVIFLLLVIFAPIFFLAGALPGAEGVTFNWFKRAISALIAIPLTGLVVNLSLAIGFSGILSGNLDSISDAVPNPITAEGFGFFAGPLVELFAWAFLAPFVGLALFFFATKIPDAVDEIMGTRSIGGRGGFGPGILLAPAALGYKGLRLAGDVQRGAPTFYGLGRQMQAASQGVGGFRGRVLGNLGSLFAGTTRPFVPARERTRFEPEGLRDIAQTEQRGQQQAAGAAEQVPGATEPRTGGTRFTPRRPRNPQPPDQNNQPQPRREDVDDN